MQGAVSDKTFHLKWNNHLQNLSQLFTTIYSSSALADVTLSCRDGTLKAHKLVLSACSPYFEQIFRDNPCQHPVVILKGIPFSEINLLVEFMYKGSVDVQELDLQSLMHTASELEIRGLAYEARDSAAQLLNVNLEYPAYTQMPVPQQSYPQQHTDVERLKQIHMYQQSMMRAEELRRRRRDDPQGTNMAVNNILAAAAREMEEARQARGMTGQQEQDMVRTAALSIDQKRESEEERSKKRPSIMSPDEEKLKAKKKLMSVRFSDELKTDEQKPSAAQDACAGESSKSDDGKSSGIKVVQLAALQKPMNNEHDDSDERAGAGKPADDDEETDSSESVSDSGAGDAPERPHVCDVCDLRFQRSSHLSRHRLTHTGERPFACGGCGRSFARSDKLRAHAKICEREDPTVDITNNQDSPVVMKRENTSEVMSGMVRTTHRESGHLVFTPSGDVMLPPRPAERPALNTSMDPMRNDMQDLMAPKRGRGRPRKTPLPLTPKIKKKRGRPPKISMFDFPHRTPKDMEEMVLAGMGALNAGDPLPLAHHLLMKKKRGRPPKTYMPTDGSSNENYNATNLPFGDFSYLTEMMYNPALAYSYVTHMDAARDADHAHHLDSSHSRTIDVSDSSTDEEDNSRQETEENPKQQHILTVGDCQIVKLPPSEEKEAPAEGVQDSSAPTSTPSSVTITPITTVGDCSIRPVENNT